MKKIVIVSLLAACTAQPPPLESTRIQCSVTPCDLPPLCSQVGCVAPSLDPSIWTPCDGQFCFCRVSPPSPWFSLECRSGEPNCEIECRSDSWVAPDPSDPAS